MTHPIDRRRFLAAAGLSWLTPVGRLLAEQAEKSARAGEVGDPAVAGRRAEPARDVRSAPGHEDRRRDEGDRHGREGDPARRGVRAAGGADGLGGAGPVAREQGGGPRARHVHDEDRISPRPDGRCTPRSARSAATSCRRAGRTSPGTSRSCRPVAGPGRVPRRRVRRLPGRRPRRASCPTWSAPPRPRATRPGLSDLDVVERAFARGRAGRVAATLHRETLARARTMMSSEQLRAFDVGREPAAVRAEYGDTPFGRGCLAARRLIEVGVRCVEVTLDGWDSHVNNHEVHRKLVGELDPAFAALIRDLKMRGLLDRTVVLCGGEFGRTPKVNLAGGRDHWPNGFSLALAGGGMRGGFALGETDPEGQEGPRPADGRRGRPRHRAGRPRPRPRQGEHRPGHGPADQAQRGDADPRAAGLSQAAGPIVPATPDRQGPCSLERARARRRVVEQAALAEKGPARGVHQRLRHLQDRRRAVQLAHDGAVAPRSGSSPAAAAGAVWRSRARPRRSVRLAGQDGQGARDGLRRDARPGGEDPVTCDVAAIHVEVAAIRAGRVLDARRGVGHPFRPRDGPAVPPRRHAPLPRQRPAVHGRDRRRGRALRDLLLRRRRVHRPRGRRRFRQARRRSADADRLRRRPDPPLPRARPDDPPGRAGQRAGLAHDDEIHAGMAGIWEA